MVVLAYVCDASNYDYDDVYNNNDGDEHNDSHIPHGCVEIVKLKFVRIRCE